MNQADQEPEPQRRRDRRTVIVHIAVHHDRCNSIDNFTKDPTERSMPAVKMTSICPKATMPKNAA